MNSLTELFVDRDTYTFHDLSSILLAVQHACGASQTSEKTGPGFSEHVISEKSTVSVLFSLCTLCSMPAALRRPQKKQSWIFRACHIWEMAFVKRFQRGILWYHGMGGYCRVCGIKEKSECGGYCGVMASVAIGVWCRRQGDRDTVAVASWVTVGGVMGLPRVRQKWPLQTATCGYCPGVDKRRNSKDGNVEIRNS